MKVNNFAILPAAVRYDKRLSPTEIVVYAEISAATNEFGICEEDNGFLANSTRMSERSISRAITTLMQCGHLERVIEFGKRKIKITSQVLEPPPEVLPEEVPADDINEYVLELIKLWESRLNCKMDKPEMYSTMIRQRLIKFTKEELLSSVRNRAHFVTKTSDWHTDPENRQYQIDISILLRDDDSVFKYLNLKPEENNTGLKAFGK